MKPYKKVVILFALACLIVPAALFASGTSHNTCATRYPIILAHGMGATDDMLGFIDYWWGIEEALGDEGARVYVIKLNGMDSTVNKAIEFRQQFLYFLAVSGAAKANIIGHSHGTIYTRYAITNLGLASKVASHTSLSGPHRGSAVADVILGILPDRGLQLVGSVVNFVYSFLMSDNSPDTVQNIRDLSRSYMTNVFNPSTPNAAGVYYQSWTGKIKTITAELVMEPTWLLMLYYEGANDGLVSVNSAKWGNFRGVESGAWWCGGVSHYNIIGQLFGITPGFDAPAFFVKIVKDLKSRGY
ncbi:MAG: alpha/beta hydrolase [Spirochaetes bacterium]|nr:alpha/beta hydrolase [Spirochaetota bacterium]